MMGIVSDYEASGQAARFDAIVSVVVVVVLFFAVKGVLK